MSLASSAISKTWWCMFEAKDEAERFPLISIIVLRPSGGRRLHQSVTIIGLIAVSTPKR